MSDLDQTVLRTSRRKTRARIDGETIDISTTEAVLNMTAQAAIKDNSHAQYLHLTYTAIAEANERACRALDIEDALRLAAHNSAIIAQARARGEDDPLVFPHSDDLKLDRRYGVRIDGPTDLCGSSPQSEAGQNPRFAHPAAWLGSGSGKTTGHRRVRVWKRTWLGDTW